MDAMTDEILDELADTDSSTIGVWFEQFGKIVAWCGSGNDDDLPDEVKPYLRQKVAERLAITAGSSD